MRVLTESVEGGRKAVLTARVRKRMRLGGDLASDEGAYRGTQVEGNLRQAVFRSGLTRCQGPASRRPSILG